MTSLDSAHVWITRLLRIAAALCLGGALTTWVTPVNVPGKNLVPIGCGSPASPKLDALTDFVCRDLVSGAKGTAVGFAIAAGVLLLLSELVVPQLRQHRWVQGAAVASVAAVPAIALAGARLFGTVATTGADGTPIRCGKPLAQATDAMSALVCGQLAERQRSLALAVMALGVVAILGGAYIASGINRGRDADTGSDDGPARHATRAGAGHQDTAEPGGTDHLGSDGSRRTDELPGPLDAPASRSDRR